MKTSESQLKAIRERGTRAASREGCLSADVLAMTARGEIGAAERERVADHLATCADCSEELKLIGPLQAWSERTAVAYGREPQSAAGTPWLWAWQLATVLLVVAAGGMLAWNMVLRQEKADLIATATPPQIVPIAPIGDPTLPASIRGAVNVPILDLQADALRGAAPGRPVASVPADAPLVTLILATDSRNTAAIYRLDVVNAAGQAVWESEALRMTPYNTFTLALSPRELGAGVFHLQLFRVNGDRREPIERYSLRVDPIR